MCNLINIHTYIYTYIIIPEECKRYFQHAHFIPVVVGVGKRGAY